ncbi:unnamed protein product, partial [Discosporangium mesarthrocarpum]
GALSSGRSSLAGQNWFEVLRGMGRNARGPFHVWGPGARAELHEAIMKEEMRARSKERIEAGKGFDGGEAGGGAGPWKVEAGMPKDRGARVGAGAEAGTGAGAQVTRCLAAERRTPEVAYHSLYVGMLFVGGVFITPLIELLQQRVEPTEAGATLGNGVLPNGRP